MCFQVVYAWARGSEQTTCLSITLLATGLSLVGIGILMMLVEMLQTFGFALPLFSAAVEMWWGMAGFSLNPTMWFAVACVCLGATCIMAAYLRIVVNLLTLLMLLSTAYCFTAALFSSMVGYGNITDDVQRLWSLSDNETICELEKTVNCRGLTAPCPQTQTQHSAGNLVKWVSWRYLHLTAIDDAQCRECHTGVAYTNVTCLSFIESDATHVITPFAMTVGTLTSGLTFLCVLCTKPMGLAFSGSTFLLLIMTYAFSCWRSLWSPSQAEVAETQRVVAAGANFIALQLSLISIGGLHWKNSYSNELKKAITSILAIVPVFALASSFALLVPATEEFFSMVREVYCTVLLWKLVTVWDHTAETVPLIITGKDSHVAAESDRQKLRSRVVYLVVVKIALDVSTYLFKNLYPPWLVRVLVWSGAVLFCVILVVIHDIFDRLPQLESTGEGQFFSVKAIVSFVFFDFTVLKLLDYEGLQSVMLGELYIAMALVGLAAFQLYTWLVIPLGSRREALDERTPLVPKGSVKYLINQR
eukprot:TRINITY_DN3619_c0_g1_i1.p1 TRINITY_DN3619_c0_g1~~TRINITY_DN3619_c0_g1_i1.p1  ORF type:complete len:531 (+),score=62.67 TRINITY_DN3619_c0_g1_i1:1068-2660(+)